MVTTWMGDHLVLGVAHDSPVNFCADTTAQKSPLDETINQGPMCKCMHKGLICTLKILKSMSEFGGIMKTLKQSTCTVGWEV